MIRFRNLSYLVVGLCAGAALLAAAPMIAVLAVIALPVAFVADKILAWAQPHLAALADHATSWLIRLLSRDSPARTFATKTPDFPAPQTGTPEVTAFA